jgi:spore coat protein CotF
MNISIELINAIMGYLCSKPYAEVAQLVSQIQVEVMKAQAPVDEQPKE